MVRNLYAGGGVQAFQGQNNPLYVQNQNELKSAFAALQNDIANAGTPIGAVVMWVGTTANIPSGFAVCNGAPLNTTTYASLFNIIQYRYGGGGINFLLPDFTGRAPKGITGVPTVPSTLLTNAASNVDAHTHSVNSSFTAGTVNSSFTAGGVNSSFTAGNAASHVHSNSFTAGSVNSSFTAGNANNHTHGVSGNTADANVAHSHGYFKPNAGANNNTTSQNPIHSHGVSLTSAGSNTTIGVNSSFTAGNTNSSFTSGGVNTAIGVNSSFTAGNVNSSFTAGNVNSSFTAGDASTINASTLTHTHTQPSTEIIFIIRVA